MFRRQELELQKAHPLNQAPKLSPTYSVLSWVVPVTLFPLLRKQSPQLPESQGARFKLLVWLQLARSPEEEAMSEKEQLEAVRVIFCRQVESGLKR